MIINDSAGHGYFINYLVCLINRKVVRQLYSAEIYGIIIDHTQSPDTSSSKIVFNLARGATILSFNHIRLKFLDKTWLS